MWPHRRPRVSSTILSRWPLCSNRRRWLVIRHSWGRWVWAVIDSHIFARRGMGGRNGNQGKWSRSTSWTYKATATKASCSLWCWLGRDYAEANMWWQKGRVERRVRWPSSCFIRDGDSTCSCRNIQLVLGLKWWRWQSECQQGDGSFILRVYNVGTDLWSHRNEKWEVRGVERYLCINVICGGRQGSPVRARGIRSEQSAGASYHQQPYSRQMWDL